MGEFGLARPSKPLHKFLADFTLRRLAFEVDPRRRYPEGCPTKLRTHWLPMRALGTIVSRYKGMDLAHCIECGMLDYYDHWTEIDPRLRHHRELSRASGVFGHDLVNLATYVYEILSWLEPNRLMNSVSVVIAGAMTEASMVSIRSAYDAIAITLAHVASAKAGQVPSGSLADLIKWAKRNPSRIHTKVREFLTQDHETFWFTRKFRDYIVHQGVNAIIHTDRRQFNVWLYGDRGWITREPLLPFLAGHYRHLLDFANAASAIINEIISLPEDRHGGRVVEGVFIHALHDLEELQSKYAAPSP
jgi:hypothetical protein